MWYQCISHSYCSSTRRCDCHSVFCIQWCGCVWLECPGCHLHQLHIPSPPQVSNLSMLHHVHASIYIPLYPCHCAELLTQWLALLYFRSTAFGIQSVFGRIGSILGNLSFGRLITVDPFIPILLVAALLIFGGLVGFLLPNPRGENTRKNMSKCARLCCCRHRVASCCQRTATYGRIQTD